MLQPDALACQALLDDLRGRRGLIVCGELAVGDAEGAAIRRLADHLGCAILAEPLSNLRFGPPRDAAICANYLSWLPDEPAAEPFRIDWVLRFGSFPVTRKLQNFLAGIRQHLWVDPWPRMSDPQHRLTHVIRATPAQFVAAAIGHSTPHPDLGLRDLCLQLDQQTPAARFWPVTTLIDAAPAGSSLLIGNSLAIRQLDAASGRGDKPLHFFGNRGANGIDGNLSTALGIARVHASVIALVGDLTCQHDIGALASSHGLNAIIVVLNNGGGGIFDTLPQAALPEFETGWRTPQTLDFALAAQAFGLSYQRAESAESLATALKLAIFSGGPHMIEVRGF